MTVKLPESTGRVWSVSLKLIKNRENSVKSQSLPCHRRQSPGPPHLTPHCGSLSLLFLAPGQT